MMGEADRDELVEAYHRALGVLWDEALRLHGCSGCAVRDLESKARATAEEWQRSTKGGDRCAGICQDARAHTKLVFRSKGRGRNRKALDFSQIERVSVQLVRVWEIGMALTGCSSCVVAGIVYDARTAAAQVGNALAKGKDLECRDSCNRCHSVRFGLV